MGSRGSEFVSNQQILSAIKDSTPDDVETWYYKNSDVNVDFDYDYKNSTYSEGPYGYEQPGTFKVKPKNADDAYKEVDVEWYEINGQVYGKFTVDGKDYIVKDNDYYKTTASLDKLLSKKGFEPIESIEEDIVHQFKEFYTPDSGWDEPYEIEVKK